MSTLDYEPTLDGGPYDPQPAGGQVATLELFDTSARTGPPELTVGPAVRQRAYVYRFTVPDTTVGRYWARVTWTVEAAGATVVDDLPGPLDLPVRDDLVVSPEALAVRLGVPLPLDDEQREQLAGAVLDAQADVEGYLGRPILPTIVRERRSWPGPWEAKTGWFIRSLNEAEVLDGNGQPTGYWDWTYLAGLNARDDQLLRPIRRLLLAHAAMQDDAVRLWSSVGSGSSGDGTGAKRVKSLSTEGQSVSYEYGRPGSGSGGGSSGSETVGGPVKWSSIDAWRINGRRVYQRGASYGGLVSMEAVP